MFKLVVLSVLLAIAAAKPSNIIEAVSAPVLKSALIQEPGHIQVHESTLAKVGDLVESVPSAVSHQSSTVVHSRANQVTPIVAPAIRSYSTPVVKTYTAPILESSPLLKTYAGAAIQTPYLRSFDGSLYNYGYSYGHGSPLLYSAPFGYAHGPIYRSF